LACGGIENPRLLLNMTDRSPAGLGNQNDMVGRCFMEHPNIRKMGWWAPKDVRAIYDYVTAPRLPAPSSDVHWVGAFSLTEQAARRAQVLNASVRILDWRSTGLLGHFPSA
jgi:hypothetical protein